MRERLGIAHSLPDHAHIIYASLNSRRSFGRISDLALEWLTRELNTTGNSIPDVRVLIQALLDFSCPNLISDVGQIEIAVDEHLIIIASRFACEHPLNPQTLEKDLTHYWLNRNEVKLFKRVLLPHDRVEVRYQSTLNLLEWRIYRSTRAGEIVDNNPSYSVFCDSSKEILAGGARFTDFADLPAHQWRTEHSERRQDTSILKEAGIENDYSQEDIECANSIVRREQVELEQESELSPNGATGEATVKIHLVENGSEQYKNRKTTIADGESTGLEWAKLGSGENVGYPDLERTELDIRKYQLKSEQEINRLVRKIQQCEILLRKKELLNQRRSKELKIINEKLEIERSKKSGEKNDTFREKALEMFERLKCIKLENASLQRMITELTENDSTREGGREGEKENGIAKIILPISSEPITNKVSDDSLKKFERISRALESEKAKVKSLSDRVVAAEKEAQAAAPLIQELESRIEHLLKVSQQYKKDAEIVKQKQVQAEAEKNKVKNELIKAQTQIQTLQKRQPA